MLFRVLPLIFFLMCMSMDVHAHSALVRAEPGPRAVVEKSPSAIRLWFNEPVEAAFSKVSIEQISGTAIANVGNPGLAPDDNRQLVIPLPTLSPGKYRVRYRVLSVDGHLVDWGYEFTVAPPPAIP
jgi:methionine-rich copper-binding protein CopC